MEVSYRWAADFPPAVVSGVACFGSTDCSLYAVDIGSGGLKSKFETKGWVVSSPAVASDVVYFLSYDSNFYAVDAGERTTEMEVPNRR